MTAEVINFDWQDVEHVGAELQKNGKTYKVWGNGILYEVNKDWSLGEQIAIQDHDEWLVNYEVEGVVYSVKQKLVKIANGEYEAKYVLSPYDDGFHGSW